MQRLYMTVYGMATSTILVCAIEAETLDMYDFIFINFE